MAGVEAEIDNHLRNRERTERERELRRRHAQCVDAIQEATGKHVRWFLDQQPHLTNAEAMMTFQAEDHVPSAVLRWRNPWGTPRLAGNQLRSVTLDRAAPLLAFRRRT